MRLPTIPFDKAQHVLYGLAIYIVTSISAWLFGLPNFAVAGLLAAVIFGVGKEGIDAIQNERKVAEGLMPEHGVELMDTVATVCGGLLGFLAQLPAWIKF